MRAHSIGWLILLPSIVQAQTPVQRAETVAYLNHLEQPSGGCVVRPGEPPTLRALTGVARALPKFGGQLRHPAEHARFVAACHDPVTGGFADRPGAMPNAVSTAVGAMAVVALGLPVERYRDGVVRFFDKWDGEIEEIRMAAAGLEAMEARSSRAADWLARADRLRNVEGTYGRPPALVRTTGSMAAMILRLGGELPDRTSVVRTLRLGQKADGSFGGEFEDRSDLETAYRVMRALKMLREVPAEPGKLREFVAGCRNPDGGYGTRPGLASSPSGTYYAAMILSWLD